MNTHESLARLAHEAHGGKKPGALKAALLADSKLLSLCIERGWFPNVIAEIEEDEKHG